MFRYETIIIVNPEKERENAYVVDDIECMIERAGGTYKTENWGNKAIAYPIKGYTRGIYTLIDFEFNRMPKGFIEKLDKFCNTNDYIIKHIIIKKG